MAKTDGSGDQHKRGAEVEIEMLDADHSRPTSSAIGGSDDVAVVAGQATSGGRRALALTAAGVAVAVVAIVGLLFAIDRAAPEKPPESAAFQQPSGLVITTTVPATTTPQAVLTVPPTIARTTLPPGEFLLGEETGLWLFYGGDETLHRLDLDNGEVVDYGIRAIPTVVTGQELVVYLRETGLIGWITADAPGEQPSIWKRGYAAKGEEPGQIWVLDLEGDMDHPSGAAVGYGRWELFDTGSSRRLDQRPGDLYQEFENLRPPREELPSSAAALRPGPALTARPDGLAVYDDERYRFISGPVEVLAYNQESILVRSCDAELSTQSCVLLLVGWDFESQSGPLPTARPGNDVLWVDFVAEDRWLLVYYGGGESELLEVAGSGRIRFPAGANPAMSDDGRWVAVQADGQYRVLETDSGEPVMGFGDGAPDGPPGEFVDPVASGLLFVPKPG